MLEELQRKWGGWLAGGLWWSFCVGGRFSLPDSHVALHGGRLHKPCDVHGVLPDRHHMVEDLNLVM